MDGGGGGGNGNGNDDEEPQICTVFSSTPSSQSKTVFDTIAFSIPKKETGGAPAITSTTPPPTAKEEHVHPPPPPTVSETTRNLFQPENVAPLPSPSSSATAPVVTVPNQIGNVPQNYTGSTLPPAASLFESLSMSYIASDPAPASVTQSSVPLPVPVPPVESLQSPSPVQANFNLTTPINDPLLGSSEVPREGLTEAGLKLLSREIEGLSINTDTSSGESGGLGDSPLPTANTLFSDAPEVAFPVSGVVAPVTNMAQSPFPPPIANDPSQSLISVPMGVDVVQAVPQENPVNEFNKATFSDIDIAYDAWILNEQTRQILTNLTVAVNAGTYFPEKTHMTAPGIIYKDDLVDKVAVNMSRIYGEVEANKRQILTADSVTQDDNGIRELIKLGCYRSAINLTKRILTLYGQGPGKLGQFSKHTPHTLQLWMTRIALLARIREFKIAESELEAFKDFQNPDMYYEYYQDLYGPGRKGSMVPFYFRLLAAEIPQYSSKDYNKSVNMLTQLLLTIQEILKNIDEGICEDGTPDPIPPERKETSLQIWKKREIRVYTSLANAFMLAKDFSNTLRCLTTLRETDPDKKPQLTFAIGRLFLQYGDLPTAQKYFKEAASLRTSGSETDRVENLIDASMYFIAQGVYTDAFGLLKEALAIQPDNFMITNNMAVCLLYMGKVKESLALMETTVRNNTPQLLQENVILNLSTIYELENSDGLKKNSLLKLISEYKGDGINLASLKMPNLI